MLSDLLGIVARLFEARADLLIFGDGQRRAVVSYAEPTAQILAHNADATVGSVRTHGLVQLAQIPATAA